MTGCDHPSFVQIGPLVDELYSISNIFKYGGRPPSCIRILPFWTTHEVNYAVRLVCENLVSIRSLPLEILRFYDFASLAGKCLPRPLLVFFGGWGWV